jgi:hypothetical protein
MGGGGSKSPAAPDYTEVIGMLKDVFKVSGERAKELWDWGKQAYETNSGIGRQAITNALGQMTKLSGDADKYRAEYTKYAPARAKQLADAMKMGSAGYQEEQAKKATQDIATRVKAARDAAMQRLEGLGISQDALAKGDLATRVAEAGMQSAGANAGREAARKEGQAALAAAIGTGEAVKAGINPAAAGSMQAGQSAAGIGPAIDQGRVMIQGNVPQQAGLGSQAAVNVANVQNMGFQNAQDKWKADEEASGSGWGALGTGLGMLTKFIPGFEEGGAIPDTQMFAAGGGPIPIEASPSAGAIPDDIPATINGSDGSQAPAQINAGEFVMPQDVVKWLGEKGMQQIVMKARKEMGSPDQAPAQPDTGGMPPPTMDGAGIPPTQVGVA